MIKDIHIDELTDRLIDKRKLNVPRRKMKKLVRTFFADMYRIAATDRDRITFGGYTAILHFYTNPDIKKICEDLAEDKDVVTYRQFLFRRIPKRLKYFIDDSQLHQIDA